VDELKFFSFLAGVNDLPFNRPCSKKAAQKEVLKFINLACKLYIHMQTMHRPSLETLRHEGVMPPEILGCELKNIAMLAAKQSKNIQGTSDIRGRKSNTQITAVVSRIKKQHENDTGERATRRSKRFEEHAMTELDALGLLLPKSPRGKKGHRTSIESQLKKVGKK
jgi:hypothetical protein